MALVKRSLRELYQGISQQPDGQRLNTQASDMINGIPSVSKGLLKRYTSVRLADMLIPIGYDNSKTYTVRAPSGELFFWVVNISTGGVEIYDATGTFLTSSFHSYISSATSIDDIDLLFSGDEVIILNKSVTVLNAFNSTETGEKLSFLRATPRAATTYKLSIYWYDAGVPRNVTRSFSPVDTKTETLITTIKTVLESGTYFPTMDARDATLVFTDPTEQVYVGFIADNANDTDLINGTGYANFPSVSSVPVGTWDDYEYRSISDPSTLPMNLDDGHKVWIKESDDSDGYYLQFSGEKWVESISGLDGTVSGLDKDTVPLYFSSLSLTNTDAIFEKNVESPEPAFLGAKISGMFFYQQRLGLISGKSVDFSEVSVPTNFYKNSMASVISSDTVSISLPDGPEQAQLIAGVPQDESLMLFGNNHQYILSSLDTETASLLHIGTYQVSDTVKPVDVGNRTFFASNNSEYSRINSMYRVDSVGNFDVDNESAHVPYLMKGNVIILEYSSTENMIFAVTDDDKSKLFLQNTLVQSGTKLQNAWHTWTFDADILNVTLIGSSAYIALSKQGAEVSGNYNAQMEVVKIFLGDTQRKTASSDTSIEFVPYLDSAQEVNQTTFASYTTYDRAIVGVDDSGNVYNGSTDIQAYLDTLGPTDTITVGHLFKFYYEFSRQLPSHFTEVGKVLETFNNLIIRRMKVSFFDTAQFIMKTIQDLRGTEYTQEFSSDTLGDINANLGRVNIKSGTFDFPVNSKSDACRVSIESESPYPCNFTSAEWSGNLIRKGSRY